MAEEHDIICAWCKKVIGSIHATTKPSHGGCRQAELDALDRWLKLAGVRK